MKTLLAIGKMLIKPAKEVIKNTLQFISLKLLATASLIVLVDGKVNTPGHTPTSL
ncbi:MAG: hypothetical protein ACJA13_000366 [Paraglaciecola sp.]|jgi:hypothetical protein